MPLEIPPPENNFGDSLFTWKATAEQNTRAGKTETIYKYEIHHEDGRKTLRTVTIDDAGEKHVEEKTEQGEKPDPTAADRKPIDPPQELPERATYDARRVVFTDEDDAVTTTVNYTIYTDKGKYAQKETRLASGELTVEKGPLEPLTEADIKTVKPAAAKAAVVEKPPLAEKTNAKTPPKPDVVGSYVPYSKQQFPTTSSEQPDAAPARSFKPPARAEPAPDTRPRVRARGSVADRYLKNLK